MENDPMAISFEKVSMTAQLAAYMRQFSDIPFARDVAELLTVQVHDSETGHPGAGVHA